MLQSHLEFAVSQRKSRPLLQRALVFPLEKSLCWVFLCVFFFLINSLVNFYFWLLGLCCCAQAFSSCREWGLLLVAVRGLLVAVASLVVEHGL